MRRAALVVAVLLGGVAHAAPSPLAYELTLAPNAAAGTFAGEEQLELAVDAATRVVHLDAVGLTLSRAGARVDGHAHAVRAIARDSGIDLRFDPPLPAGRAVVQLAWTGRLATELHGLYRARADDRDYVFTQLEPDAARKVFPCFDAPAQRARFTIHVVIADDEQAVSNGAVIAEQPADGHHKLVTFAPTPPLPTYLVSLAIGRFDAVEGRGGLLPVRVLAPPGRHDAAAAALATTLPILAAFEEFLGIDFPFAKLDIVAVPHLGPHAMENAGAIFVRSDELLIDADASADDVRRRARRLAHELAHQWFGDLVTMAAWNDLWLSEGLARWAEFEILDRVYPAWHVRDEFHALRDRVFGLDVQHAIRPPPGGGLPAFDPITYDKGAATVRMLQVWMGDEAFVAGLRRYLRTRAFGAASSEQFWSALGGAEVVEVAHGWFERVGHPLLSVDVRCAGGALDVHLRQEGLARAWAVPLVLRTPTTAMHLVMRHGRAALRLREPGGCAALAIEDAGELPFAVRYAGDHRHDRAAP